MKVLPIIDPVIPVARKRAFDDPEYLFELKYDGNRGILYFDGESCSLVSKRGIRLPFKALENELSGCIKAKSAVLDGEVCALDEKGIPSLERLSRREGAIVYVAFDIMYLDGRDLRGLPLRKRKRILERFRNEKAGGCLQIAAFIEREGLASYRVASGLGLEGIVAKRLESLYTPRARWLKIKNPDYPRPRHWNRRPKR